MKKELKKKLLYLALVLVAALVSAVLGLYEEPEHNWAPDESRLTVHFIDVGQADCALLECDGYYMLIDGGNKEDGQKVISYLQQQGVEELEAVVCTHAHEDHVGGLPAVLAVFPTKAVYAPTKTYSSKVFDDFLYYTDQQRLEVTIPQPGEEFPLGGTNVLVLGPVKSYAEPNDTSIVLRVDHKENSFLFTGDMEVTAENDMMDHWADTGIFDTDVLKVGHHGSDTSTGYRFLHTVMPTYGIISVGEGNKYNHPNELPLSRLKQAGVVTMRTDKLGTVVAASDGFEITFTWENQKAQPEDVEPAQAARYIGNKKSKTLHVDGCGSLPKEDNQEIFNSYEEAMAAGYSPCSGCLG